ncbi:MAG: hypothetical protein QMD92_07840 [bacterium]|nr:hypothetical protein [bacterium]
MSKKDISHLGQKLDFLIEGKNKYGFEIFISYVLSMENVDYVEKFLEFMNDKKVPVNFIIKYPIHDELLTERDINRYTKAIDTILYKMEEGYNVISTKYYLKFAKRHIREKNLWKCYAGSAFFVVDIDGKVGICDRLELERMNYLDITIDKLNGKNFYLVAQKGRQIQEYPDCSKRCLISCAFETSYFVEHPLRFVQKFIMDILKNTKLFRPVQSSIL